MMSPAPAGERTTGDIRDVFTMPRLAPADGQAAAVP
jgi:hypothetical protein